ncbi:MAG TPA: response regulator, partial [Fibrobacteraceae bacterium]|nr:response regulator [Fibrobacteraceae bacterium]
MNPVRLLVVDDSRVFRAIIADLLKDDSGIRIVGSLWSGEKALDFLTHNEVDVVTLDVEMPGIDGLETLRRIQQINQNRSRPIGVIMLSSL